MGGQLGFVDTLHLVRTAEPVGGRKLDEAMAWVLDAPFTDREVEDLYRFLRSRIAR